MQGSESVFVDLLRDVSVPRALSATPAAMGEKDKARAPAGIVRSPSRTTSPLGISTSLNREDVGAGLLVGDAEFICMIFGIFPSDFVSGILDSSLIEQWLQFLRECPAEVFDLAIGNEFPDDAEDGMDREIAPFLAGEVIVTCGAALLMHLFDKVIQVAHLGFLSGDFPAIDIDRLDEHRQLTDELYGFLRAGLVTQDMQRGAQDGACGGSVFLVPKLCGDFLDEVLPAAGVFFKVYLHVGTLEHSDTQCCADVAEYLPAIAEAWRMGQP